MYVCICMRMCMLEKEYNTRNYFPVPKNNDTREVETRTDIKVDMNVPCWFISFFLKHFQQPKHFIMLFNYYVTLSCLYATFHWLIYRVQLSVQPLSTNVLRLTDSRGDSTMPCGFNPQGHGPIIEAEARPISRHYVIIG